MNYLELCKATADDAGIRGGGPVTVVNQSGQYGKIVRWVARAWNQLQGHHNRWKWQWTPFHFDTVTDKGHYVVQGAGGWDLEHFERHALRLREKDGDSSDEDQLWFLPWDRFRDIYLVGTWPSDRPDTCSINPKDELYLASPPDSTGYTVEGELWRGSVPLINDTDTPLIPEEYHDIIIKFALLEYYRAYAYTDQYQMVTTDLYGNTREPEGRMKVLRRKEWLPFDEVMVPQ